ncbi:MAG: hypothetical protein AAF243_11495 [Cyanobacteria bacterium P01_A01_bin.137]
MVQLIAFLLMVTALMILVLQNLSPVLPLVVLGRPLVALPLSLWVLGAIAIGILCTLVIYQLVPKKRAYRPMGQRLSDPVPEPPNRFVESASERGSSQVPQPDSGQRQNPYDSDWENFRAPEQWDDWGQTQPGYASADPRTGDRPGPSADDAVRDIESGWGDDGYGESRRPSYREDGEPASYRDDGEPDIGWRSDGAERPSTRTYGEGWLYGNDSNNDSNEEPDVAAESEPPQSEEPEDVYDANYRVIIPPHDTKDS